MPSPLTGGTIKRWCCLTSVCLSRTSGLSQEQSPRKTKIGTDVGHVIRDSDTTFTVKRSRSPGRFTRRSVNASGSCSGERGNVLAMGTYCYVAVCILQVRSARRREALRRPQREEMGGAYCGGRPPTACFRSAASSNYKRVHQKLMACPRFFSLWARAKAESRGGFFGRGTNPSSSARGLGSVVSSLSGVRGLGRI